MADYLRLVEKINKRKKREWLMQVAIARNPHEKDPTVLVNQLQDIEVPDYIKQETLDKNAFAAFRDKLAGTGKFQIK